MLSHIPAVAAKIIVFEALLLAVMSQLRLISINLCRICRIVITTTRRLIVNNELCFVLHRCSLLRTSVSFFDG